MIDVALANVALQKIGADDQLADPDEASHLGRTLRVSWDDVRRICLRELTPTFAKRRRRLPARVATTLRPVIGFDNAFPLPGECLRLLEVLEPAGLTAYRKIGAEDEAGAAAGEEVLADCDGPLGVEMIVDVADTSLWDPLFRQSFADRLGVQIADRVTCDLNRVERCQRDYTKAAAKAGGADSKEQPPIETPDSSWVTSRNGGPDLGWGAYPPNV